MCCNTISEKNENDFFCHYFEFGDCIGCCNCVELDE